MPPVLNSFINIVPDPIDITLVGITQHDIVTTFNYSVTIQRGTLYSVTGFGGNVIGNGSARHQLSICENPLYEICLFFPLLK